MEKIKWSVGDRVRFYNEGKHHEGMIYNIVSNDLARVGTAPAETLAAEESFIYIRLIDCIKL